MLIHSCGAEVDGLPEVEVLTDLNGVSECPRCGKTRNSSFTLPSEVTTEDTRPHAEVWGEAYAAARAALDNLGRVYRQLVKVEVEVKELAVEVQVLRTAAAEKVPVREELREAVELGR